MSMETRMSLPYVSQEYSFCACAVLGKWPSTTDYRICGSENWVWFWQFLKVYLYPKKKILMRKKHISIIFEEVHLIGKFLFEAIFINSQSKICFTLWAFAYCLLQASSDWRWLAVESSQGKTNFWLWIDENCFKHFNNLLHQHSEKKVMYMYK